MKETMSEAQGKKQDFPSSRIFVVNVLGEGTAPKGSRAFT